MIVDIVNLIDKHDPEYITKMKSAVIQCLTYFGGSMYTYMLFLEHEERKAEEGLIFDYRKTVFDARVAFDLDKEPIQTVLVAVEKVILQLDTHITLLRATPGRQWEAGAFCSLTDEMRSFIFTVKGIYDKIAAANS